MPNPSQNRFLGRWSGASLASGSILLGAVLVFAIVPDWLAGGGLVDSPLLRDLLIVGWTTVGFVFLAWLVVRLQGERPR